MQVQHAGGAGTFVQVVHILGDDIHPEILLQLGHSHVGGVGLGILKLGPALVVKLQHQLPVAVPALDGGYVVHVILFPQTTCVAEGGESAFGRNPGPGQNH